MSPSPLFDVCFFASVTISLQLASPQKFKVLQQNCPVSHVAVPHPHDFVAAAVPSDESPVKIKKEKRLKEREKIERSVS